MKALITGSDGFIGSAFVEELAHRGYDLTTVDLKSGTDALDFFKDSDEQFDLIVHAAYLVGGRASIDGLNLNLASNIQLDGAMFNYALRTRSHRVLYFSSSAGYPTRLQTGEIPHRLREGDITLGGDSRAQIGVPDAHYGWAKITGEKLAQQARAMGLNVHVVRPMSGYSENQSLDYPFPSIMDRAIEGDFTVWGPPEQTRDWIHEDDIVAGCMAIIEQNVQEPINLCTGIGHTMGYLLQKAHLIAHGRHLRTEDIFFDLSKPTGVLYRVGNPTKFFDIYRPKVSLNEGITRALAYM